MQKVKSNWSRRSFHSLSTNFLVSPEASSLLLTLHSSPHSPFDLFPSIFPLPRTMRPSYSYFSSYSSLFYLHHDDQPLPSTTVSIPIDSPPSPTATPIPVRIPGPTAAAVRIQSAFRAHLVRSLVGRIRAVEAEADAMERVIRRQETVDAVRRDSRERARVAESLMALLLRLDALPGVYPPVRELRRAATRRVVALQEVFDAVLAAPEPAKLDGFPGSWDEFIENITGGEEGEEEDEEVAEELRSSEKKGFDCLERFLLGM